MAGWFRQICRPISNVNALWSVNAAANIADVVVNPTAGDGVTITAGAADDSETQSYNLALPATPMTADYFLLDVYSKKAGAPGATSALVYTNSGYLFGFTIPAGTEYAWGTTNSAADVPYGPGKITAIQLDFVSPVMASADNIYVDVAYVTVRGYPLSVQIVEWLLWLGLGLEIIKPVLNWLAISAGNLKDPKLMVQYAKWALQKQYRCVGKRFGNIINDSLREGYVVRPT